MICRRRPCTPTSSRVGSSAVGLLLLMLSSFLVWGTDFASSAEGTTTAASGADAAFFDKDVAVSPKPPVPAEKAQAAALAQSPDRGAEDVGSSLSKGHRSLQSNVYIAGDTTNATQSGGNPNLSCGDDLSVCINGCRSRFYKVTGGTGEFINVATCGSVNFAQRLYVWKGSGGSACSAFTCTGTYASRPGSVVLVRVVLLQRQSIPVPFSHAALTCATRSGRYTGLRC
jgi:hypothetical protein